jgi:hypothetical protein
MFLGKQSERTEKKEYCQRSKSSDDHPFFGQL